VGHGKSVPGAPTALVDRSEQAEQLAAQVKEAAAHAEQVAALLAAQAQEQREREREDAEASLNASLVGSGTRQKLQGNL
jgi:F0F1-type ATP synthase membrane subunit b/b'